MIWLESQNHPSIQEQLVAKIHQTTAGECIKGEIVLDGSSYHVSIKNTYGDASKRDRPPNFEEPDPKYRKLDEACQNSCCFLRNEWNIELIISEIWLGCYLVFSWCKDLDLENTWHFFPPLVQACDGSFHFEDEDKSDAKEGALKPNQPNPLCPYVWQTDSNWYVVDPEIKVQARIPADPNWQLHRFYRFVGQFHSPQYFFVKIDDQNPARPVMLSKLFKNSGVPMTPLDF